MEDRSFFSIGQHPPSTAHDKPVKAQTVQEQDTQIKVLDNTVDVRGFLHNQQQ
jgi:hypothetical protein